VFINLQIIRNVTIITALLFSSRLYGQQISGVVIDKQSRQLLANALITSSKTVVFSDVQGRFTIGTKGLEDTIKISKSGYSTYQVTGQAANTSLLIELIKQTIELNEVKVFAKRDRVKDSLNTRAMFAKSFNSAAPKFSDIVRVTKANGAIPIAGITIIPSELIKAIGYKRSREYKFKKTLLRDEDDKYIDDRFDKDLVSAMTKLQNDSLSIFMEKYRPSISLLKKMTSYDLMMYIKTSLNSFKSNL
jgi:transposase-like protein